MRFRILNPLDDADWNTRWPALSGETFFNISEWARVLHDTYGYTPCYLTSAEGEGHAFLLPLMEVDSWLTGRRGVALPFSDFCEPVGMDWAGPERVIQDLIEVGTRRRWRYVEIRHHVSPDVPCAERHFKHTVDLTAGEQPCFSRLDGSVRTSIRKSVKSGVEVTFSDSVDAMEVFFNLHCLTRRRHGLPPQPLQFFRNIQRHILSKGLGCVASATYGGRVIAASMFFLYGRNVLFKYGASDPCCQHLRASNLLMWEAIKRYAVGGFETLSLGRTAKSHAGLRRFKLSWGSEEKEEGYIKYDFRKKEFQRESPPALENGHAMMRHLPLCVLRWCGMALYRHMA